MNVISNHIQNTNGNSRQMYSNANVKYLGGVGFCKSNTYSKFACAICKNQKDQLEKMNPKDCQDFLEKNGLTMEQFDSTNHPTMIFDSNLDIKCVCPSLNQKVMHYSGKGKIECSYCQNPSVPHTWSYCNYNPNRKELRVGWYKIG